MNARVRRHGEQVSQDNPYRTWKLKVHREQYDPRKKREVPCPPSVWIYHPDDSYELMLFESRSKLMAFVKQLQRVADEVWPV